MITFEIQTRSEEKGLAIHKTLKAALKFAENEKSVWKISFDLPNGERARLVKRGNDWVLEQMDLILDMILDEYGKK